MEARPASVPPGARCWAAASAAGTGGMSYDEVEIEDMTWDEKLQAYTYMCPCGDLFQITKVRLAGRLRVSQAETA